MQRNGLDSGLAAHIAHTSSAIKDFVSSRAPLHERTVNGAAQIGESRPQRADPPAGDPSCVPALMIAVSELMDAIGSALAGENAAATECVRRAGAILSTGPNEDRDERYEMISKREDPVSIQGGLAPWQIRRVANHIEANLESVIRTGDLARLVRLSPSHFMRSFRCSFGCSPHRYVMQRRTERAQGLMLTTRVPLGQIASECGLADQSHLTRIFRRFVGESPAAWRRARAVAPEQG